MAVNLTYLTGLFNTNTATSGGANDLLSGIAGLDISKSRYNGASSLQSLRQAASGRERWIADTAKEPVVQREVSAFRAGVAKAKSVEDLLSDPVVMKVLLRVNGLADQEAYAALARKALLSDPADSNSLLNRLPDKRWKTMAQTYQFAAKGLDVLRDPRTMDTLANAYAEVTWRKSLDKTTPGLSDALAFRERASQVTSDLEILGDPILRRVVTTTLGLPLEIALQSVETQQKSISTRLDISKLRDPKFVETFTQRYLLEAADKANRDAGRSYSPFLSTGLMV